MISGHSGALTTVHATTANDAAIRLETLSLMSDVALPVHVARTQVASAIQLVVQISRFLDGSRKIRAISECLGLDENGNYKFQDLYRFEAKGLNPEGKLLGEIVPTGEVPTFAGEAGQMGCRDRIKWTEKLFGTP
jgi:pilus assembly protein CpaF